jgi:hypothetical protein
MTSEQIQGDIREGKASAHFRAEREYEIMDWLLELDKLRVAGKLATIETREGKTYVVRPLFAMEDMGENDDEDGYSVEIISPASDATAWTAFPCSWILRVSEYAQKAA